MNRYYFSITISADEFLRVYQGSAKNVLVTDEHGRRIQIPANRFVPFVSRLGIVGRFCLTTDSQHKFVSLDRL